MSNLLGRRIVSKICLRQNSNINNKSSKSCSAQTRPLQLLISNNKTQSRQLSQASIPCSLLRDNLISKTRSEQYKQPGSDDKNYLYEQIRLFQNVGQYHNVADDTLHTIQDAVEDLIEDNYDDDDDSLPEVNYASGVLTLSFPPHGTWVINKQTPNEQLWWSSPISGPRRYEYIEERERWVYTRVMDEGDGKESAPALESDDDTLGGILSDELKEIYGWDLDVDA